MTEGIEAIVEKIRALERELEMEFAKQRAGLRIGLEKGRALFEEDVIRLHKQKRMPLVRYVFTARPLVALVSPIIYALIAPFALVDLCVSIYQAICFRVYAIPQVRRSDYMVFDRAGLAYLNALEKLNCAYCSYVNGVIAYAREIASRTEQYWCPIKHARRVLGAHPRYAAFEDFGDGRRYRDALRELRIALRNEAD